MNNKYKDLTKLCKQKGISYYTAISRIKRYGMTIEEAVNTPISNKNKKGIKERCDKLGLSYGTISGRMLRKNLSFEEAVDFKRQSMYRYNNQDLKDYCKENGLSINSFKYYRYFYGYTIEQWLEKVKELNKNKSSNKTGKSYSQIKQLSEKHNIDYRTVFSRIRKGMSLEEALTTPLRRGKGIKK